MVVLQMLRSAYLSFIAQIVLCFWLTQQLINERCNVETHSTFANNRQSYNHSLNYYCQSNWPRVSKRNEIPNGTENYRISKFLCKRAKLESWNKIFRKNISKLTVPLDSVEKILKIFDLQIIPLILFYLYSKDPCK